MAFLDNKQLNDEQLKCLIEAALFVSEKPMSVQLFKKTVLEQYNVSNKRIITQINELRAHYQNRGVELVKVATGYRFQAVAKFSNELANLFKERAPRYSRALLETLSLIAYKQPITRGAIEDIRGVAVSSAIMKTLLERDWIDIVGYKEVPGRPALYATTQVFLDYFSLETLSDLPKPLSIEKVPLTEFSLSDEP
ncbi:SMC-Scp complex subunit ScpB [Pseudocolwellia agarivorans]|uniref:SMC-Scp complex subunit ScpB n=2 Tax=Colwelliaceae TaxID=267889 RepID=UPI00098539EE|nr:SMC-Scp complex subunit ScpB [Pseudocolwellia agarivorans]